MKMKGIRQHDNRDCGAACLATIFQYYGLKIPLVKVREMLKVDKNGSSLFALSEIANKLNFETNVLNGTYEEMLDEIQKGTICFPLLIHTIQEGYGHYIIIKDISGDNIKIFDPGRGHCIYKKQDFLNVWTGYVISFQKTILFQKENLTKNLNVKYWQIFISQKKILFKTVLVSLILSMIVLISALAYQKLVDNFILDKNQPTVLYSGTNKILINIFECLNNFMTHFWSFFAIILILYLIQTILSIVKGIWIAKISSNVKKEIVAKYFEQLVYLPLSFFKDRETGEILSRFSDIGEIEQLISEGGVTILTNIFMVLSGGVVLLHINIYMFLMVILILFVYTAIVLVYKKPISNIKTNILESNSKIISRVKETIDNIQDLKCMCREEKKEEELKEGYSKLLKYSYNGRIVLETQRALLNNTERIGGLCILWIGSLFVIKGMITLGNLIVFESLIQFFLSPFQQLIAMQIELQGAFIAMDRLNDVLEIKSEKDECIGDAKPLIINSDIIYQNVSFRYNFDEMILKDINLSFKYGLKYAVIGESGCGKSTLVKLLVRYYQYQSGKIKIGDYKLSDIELGYLRKKIKYLSVDSKLFAGTIRNNLLQGCNETITEREFSKIINGCNVQKIIEELPNGLDTRISEGGAELSSGQRQRLIIARALLAKPEILILDEATSNLDKISEQNIFKFIMEYCKECTCITVLHNLELIPYCDKVIKMKEGKIISEENVNKFV